MQIECCGGTLHEYVVFYAISRINSTQGPSHRRIERELILHLHSVRFTQLGHLSAISLPVTLSGF